MEICRNHSWVHVLRKTAYLDSSAISASWICFLSANCEGKRRVMMSFSRTVGLYFLVLKNWQKKGESLFSGITHNKQNTEN